MAPERTPPSSEEVARRLSSLYDQAEMATGNFNGTRALANSTRRPGRRGSGQGSGGSEPAQEDLMRQYFDGARSRFGPSAPAILPADRLPDRSGAGARPKEGARGSKGSSSDLPTVYELEQIVRPVAELTAASMLELTAGPSAEPSARPVLELTAGPVAETGGAPAATGAGVAVRAALPAGAAPAAAPQKSPLHGRKQSARRKLAAAQELMARHTARQSFPVPPQPQAPAIEYRPVEEPLFPSLPSAPQTAAYQSIPQAPAFQPAPQSVAYEQAPRTAAFQQLPPSTPFQAAPAPQPFDTGSMPRAYDTGSMPRVPETGSMPRAYETGSMPQVQQTGSMPRVYEPAPAAAESRSVLLPLSYEPTPPESEYSSVLLPLSYETPTRPSGYRPAPEPPVSEPAPQPPVYEPVSPAAYRSAPMPPVGEPVPQPPVYAPAPPAPPYQPAPMPPMNAPAPQAPAFASAPPAPAYRSAPMPPMNEPVAPPVDDAWRQALRTTGEQQAWPAAPAAGGTNPGFNIDSLVAPAAPPVVGHDSRAAEAVAFARAQVGMPCVWGASGPGSYDPSGLTQAAWKSAGVMLPRATQDQAQAGPAVALTEMQPGDLVFFHANVSHVGLYVGDGMMVHAPSPGARIAEESVAYAGQAAVHSVVRPV
ncbi:NlpC/P60 family protein [Streptomyces sp. NPDC002667]|uniref:C40 family peptidase n=1 Tax=Streptomyces sp. NPDC002667 TaxID=3364657 RepID=UPI0036A3D8E8